MKKIILMTTTALFITACTTQNDVAIQTAHATARTQECAAVASIAQSGAASEAAVLMAARGCGTMAAPKTTADRMISLASALSPIAGAAIAGAVSLETAKVAAEVQRDNIAAGTQKAQIDADVLTTLGQDQVVTVTQPDPIIVNQPDPIIVNQPDPIIVNQPDPIIVDQPDPVIIPAPTDRICSTNADGVLICN